MALGWHFIQSSIPQTFADICTGQGVSVLSCWIEEAGLEVMGGCVQRVLGHIHSRHILVILVPLCPRGQFCPHLLGSHISQLLVWRDWCPLLWERSPRGLPRAGVWALFQEPALSPPPQHLPAESSNKSHCAHV